MLGCITLLAAGDQVSLGGTTSPGQGDHMVHGEIFDADPATAVMTDAGSCFLLPPAAFAQGSGLVALCPDEGVINPEAEHVIHLLSVLQQEAVGPPR